MTLQKASLQLKTSTIDFVIANSPCVVFTGGKISVKTVAGPQSIIIISEVSP